MANNQQNESVAIQKYIKNMQKEIDECTNKIHALKKEISIQKGLLYDTCVHEWYIDRDDCWDSICNKRCKYCQLWQNNNCN